LFLLVREASGFYIVDVLLDSGCSLFVYVQVTAEEAGFELGIDA
jgi:hypothetical protein